MCNATGINEYLFLLSLRHPDAIRCASHELATVALPHTTALHTDAFG